MDFWGISIVGVLYFLVRCTPSLVVFSPWINQLIEFDTCQSDSSRRKEKKVARKLKKIQRKKLKLAEKTCESEFACRTVQQNQPQNGVQVCV